MKNKLLFLFAILCKFTFSQNGFTTYSCTLTSAQRNITAIEYGENNDIWFGLNHISTNNAKLIKFDGINWYDYSLNINFRIQSLKYAGNGIIWAGSPTDGLFKFDGVSYVQFNTSNSAIPSNNILSIEKFGNDYFIGTTAGFSIFDGINFTNYSKANTALTSDSIYTFEKDNMGQIWIGTAKGLNKMNISNFISPVGLNDFVYDVMIDADGNKWLGTKNNGLIRYNGTNFTNAREISGEIIGLNYPNEILSVGTSPSGNPIITGCYNIPGSFNTYFIKKKSIIEVIRTGGYKTFIGSNDNINLNHNIKFGKTNGSAVYYYSSVSSSTASYTRLFLNRLDFNAYDYRKQFDFITPEQINFLDINNVKAACLPGSDMHGDDIKSLYEVPKGSGKKPTFKTSIWVGGYTSSQLRIAAETYRIGAKDFQPGPLAINSLDVDTTTLMNFNKVWKINKSMVDDFRINYLNGNVTNATYIIPQEILDWPGNSPVNQPPFQKLAPYIDANNDGFYNPYDGDYPYFNNADQLLFWVINDAVVHYSTGSNSPLGVQIGVTAYAYFCPQINEQDKVINNTTFYHYDIINMSFYQYDSLMVGFWEDTDLGNYQDDFTGCDVQNNFAFVYNGDNYDDDGVNGANGYLGNTPYFSLNILKGSAANTGDGIDNDRDGCIDCTWQINPNTQQPDLSLPPISDAIEPEYNRLSRFVPYNNNSNATTGNPSSSGQGIEFYRYMSGKWRNGRPIIYDGLTGTSQTGEPCLYMYPGSSDPYGFGVGGSAQNPRPRPIWNEETAGNVPADRRFLASSGKTTLLPNGGKIEIDMALVFTQDSIALANGTLYNRVVSDNNKIYNWFRNNNAPSCLNSGTVGIKTEAKKANVLIYPNPAINQLTIESDNEIKEVKITNLLGQEIYHTFIQNNNKANVSLDFLNSGIYIIHVKSINGDVTGKFIKQN